MPFSTGRIKQNPLWIRRCSPWSVPLARLKKKKEAAWLDCCATLHAVHWHRLYRRNGPTWKVVEHHCVSLVLPLLFFCSRKQGQDEDKMVKEKVSNWGGRCGEHDRREGRCGREVNKIEECLKRGGGGKWKAVSRHTPRREWDKENRDAMKRKERGGGQACVSTTPNEGMRVQLISAPSYMAVMNDLGGGAVSAKAGFKHHWAIYTHTHTHTHTHTQTNAHTDTQQCRAWPAADIQCYISQLFRLLLAPTYNETEMGSLG